MNVTRGMTVALCAATLAFGFAVPVISQATGTNPAHVAAKSCSRLLAAHLHTRLASVSYIPQPLNRSNSVFSLFAPNALTLTARSPSNHRVVATAVCSYNGAGRVNDIAVHRP